ncbi:MAG TPA: AAA family ATPase, partial [Burkholderiales bacterium]|nr:AAA family ATPase [Burkholderiales bacterium]
MSVHSERLFPELVGRAREEAALQRFARAAMEGEGATVLVSGETGVGKTVLVDATLSRTKLLPVRAAAIPINTPSLGPIAALLRALRRDVPDAFASVANNAPAIGGLLSAGDELEPARNRAALFDEIADAFVGIAQTRALALVLDDLQWADYATLELLPILAKRARNAPLLVAAIYRSDAVAQGHAIRAMRETLRRARLLNEIPLRPLDYLETLSLIGHLLGDAAQPALAETIWERSGGVPLYVDALVATLQSRDCSSPDSSASVGLSLPETARDAIVARVDALSAPARRAAEGAAVAGIGGPEFSLEFLAQL